jgi:hypothetical protein
MCIHEVKVREANNLFLRGLKPRKATELRGLKPRKATEFARPQAALSIMRGLKLRKTTRSFVKWSAGVVARPQAAP